MRDASERREVSDGEEGMAGLCCAPAGRRPERKKQWVLNKRVTVGQRLERVKVSQQCILGDKISDRMICDRRTDEKRKREAGKENEMRRDERNTRQIIGFRGLFDSAKPVWGISERVKNLPTGRDSKLVIWKLIGLCYPKLGITQ